MTSHAGAHQKAKFPIIFNKQRLSRMSTESGAQEFKQDQQLNTPVKNYDVHSSSINVDHQRNDSTSSKMCFLPESSLTSVKNAAAPESQVTEVVKTQQHVCSMEILAEVTNSQVMQ